MKKGNGNAFLRLLSYLKKYWFFILIVMIMASFCGVAEILIARLGGDVTQHLIDSIGADPQQRLETLYRDLFPILMIAITGVLCAFAENQIMVRIAQRTLYQLRKELMAKVQRLPISYFDQHTNGEIMSYFTNDIDSIVNALSESLANSVLSLTKIIGTITTLFLINVPLTFIVILFILLMIGFMILNAKITKKYFKRQQTALAQVNGRVEEDVLGLRVIQAYGHQKSSEERFLKENGRWREASEKAFYHTQMNTPFFVALSYLNFSVSSVLGVIGLCTGVFGALTFGGLQTYLVLTRNACQPFNFFTQHLNNFLVASAGAGRIFAFLDEKEEVDEGKIVLKKKTGEEKYYWYDETSDEFLSPVRGEIEFDRVSFSYVKGKEILKEISFTCKPGERKAFVGSTGAGKTTIISLLARFYPLDSGHIYYDGIDIETIGLTSLRRAISMITQDTNLFTGTIRENIRYVRMHSSDEEIEKAAELSRADRFIRKLPEGFDMMLYDQGNPLSAGQKQLVGLARASLNKPPVMILDEATSNIDTRSEKWIQRGLVELMKDRTVLIIAHRLSTIEDCDEIMVLERGRIVERGKQEELLAMRGLYWDLYTGKRELS